MSDDRLVVLGPGERIVTPLPHGYRHRGILTLGRQLEAIDIDRLRASFEEAQAAAQAMILSVGPTIMSLTSAFRALAPRCPRCDDPVDELGERCRPCADTGFWQATAALLAVAAVLGVLLVVLA